MQRIPFGHYGGLPLAIIASVLVGCQSAKNSYEPPPPPEVTVASPITKEVTPLMEENGMIEAVEEADVRARVQGFVESIEFRPGQQVKMGDVLFRIEKDQYQSIVNSAKATVDAAVASVEVAKAAVTRAEADALRTAQNLARERSMMEKQAGSQAQLDAAIAENDAAVAALKSAKANVQAAEAEQNRSEASLAQAELDLGYTEVKSPINGRISKTDVKMGNLVENGTKLATVVDHNAMFANFSVSDRKVLRMMEKARKKLRANEELSEPDWSSMQVYLKRETDESFGIEGVMDYVDQKGVDSATGTLGLRAVFENKHDKLFPGLFVSVRVPVGDPQEVMLLPEYAVLRDQRGQYCLVINDEQKVERADVTVSQVLSGWSVIESGVTLESTVVIDGQQRARPGIEVSATTETLQLSDDALMRGFTDDATSDSQSADAKPDETGADSADADDSGANDSDQEN
ncbi:efflux RND transporter periplasmic adaptor subunit [Rhodopirellula sallentina]|nr:efflux RND transporter periplasmic adaptor subunit [Rhodopirellula sallentina]